jgi:4-amino-4-deoxy-L-arabinose transferase-like glycosyltransferase
MVLLALGVLTLLRLWYATQLGLAADEAYYWVWSKHLAASYRDKGPAIAWTIALSRMLFGETFLGIRFFGVLLGTGTAWELYRLGRRLYDERTAVWCLILALLLPLFAVGSVLMTIDSLSVFFWAWAVNLFWDGLETGRTRYWLLLGLAIGVGFLAKFTNGAQVACIGLFLCWSRPHRHFLFSRQSVVAGLAFAFCLTPIVWWNIQTGWIHALALQDRSGAQESFGIHPLQLWRYLGLLVAVLSPLLPFGMVIAAVGLWRKHSEEPRVKLLLTQFVPLQALFLLFSLNKAGQPNWIAPSLITGIVLLVVFWRELLARVPRWRPVVWTGLILAAIMTAGLHLMTFLSLPPAINPLKRSEGWTVFAQHVQEARERYQPDVLIGHHYSTGSIMQFYLPDHPVTYLPPQRYAASQFALWPSYEVRPGTKALFVRDGTDPIPKSLLKQFTHSRLVDEFWSEHNGQRVYLYRIFLLDCEQGPPQGGT